MNKLRLICLTLIILTSCKINRHYRPLSFEESTVPEVPDYSQVSNWASLPQINDPADRVPSSLFADNQQNADVDVFFIHPTTFLSKSDNWNASLDDQETNNWTDNGPILHQASVFNESCRIYAPRYRQAHIKSYFHADEGGYQALELAYSDVKAAFEYYLENYNANRPFIIASHSQGTNHAVRLIHEYIENQDLEKRLIAAYLIGMPVKKDEFKSIKPCLAPEQNQCFCSWMTYSKGYKPKFYKEEWLGNSVTNPLTFNEINKDWSEYKFHKGIVMPSFNLKYESKLSAKSQDGMLQIKKPKVWYRFMIRTKNWHKADYNLFWVNIRNNVKLRTSTIHTLNPEK